MSTIHPSVPVHRMLRQSVRPARVATLFFKNPHWMHVVEEMLGAYSQVWGGAGNVLVPVDDDGTIHKCFLRLLRLYDPDYVARYDFTSNDWSQWDPPRFKAWQKQRQSELASSGVHPDGIDDLIKHEARTSASSEMLPPSLIADIKQAASPFHRGERLRGPVFRFGDDPPRQLTDLTLLRPSRNPEPYTLFDVGKLPQPYRLALLARTGGVPKKLRSFIVENRIPCRNFDFAKLDFRDLMYFVRSENGDIGLAGQRDSSSFRWPRTPLGHSVIGCKQFSYDPDPVPTVCPILVGSSVEDFCLYLFLQRLVGSAYWLPSVTLTADDELASKYRAALLDTLNDNRSRMSQEELAFAISSVSCEDQELQQVKNILEEGNNDEFDIDITLATEIPVSRTLTYQDDNATNLPMPTAFVDGALATQLQIPTPSLLATVLPPRNLAWMVDVGVEGVPFANRAALTSVVAPDSIGGMNVRAAKNHVTVFSQHQGLVIGDRPEHVWASLSFRTPSAIEVFRALASAANQTVTMSDKGGFAQAVIEIWGDMENLTTDLQNQKKASFLSIFVADPKDRGAPGMLLGSAPRRYLSFDDAAATLQDSPDETRALLDDYTNIGVLSRGLIIQCDRCRNKCWYPLGSFSETFKCERCRHEATVLGRNCTGDNEARWYYGLNEVVFQFLKNNGELPVLSLMQLTGIYRNFSFAPELEFSSPEGDKIEMDICALVRERIVVGEVKKDERIEPTKKAEFARLERIRRIAHSLTADEVVFATSAAEWRSTTIEYIKSVFRGSGLQIRIIEGVLTGRGNKRFKARLLPCPGE